MIDSAPKYHTCKYASLIQRILIKNINYDSFCINMHRTHFITAWSINLIKCMTLALSFNNIPKSKASCHYDQAPNRNTIEFKSRHFRKGWYFFQWYYYQWYYFQNIVVFFPVVFLPVVFFRWYFFQWYFYRTPKGTLFS